MTTTTRAPKSPFVAALKKLDGVWHHPNSCTTGAACDSARYNSRCYVAPQHMQRAWLERSKWANIRRLARHLGIACPWFESGLTRALVVSKVYAACNKRALPVNSCSNRC